MNEPWVGQKKFSVLINHILFYSENTYYKSNLKRIKISYLFSEIIKTK